MLLPSPQGSEGLYVHGGSRSEPSCTARAAPHPQPQARASLGEERPEHRRAQRVMAVPLPAGVLWTSTQAL